MAKIDDVFNDDYFDVDRAKQAIYNDLLEIIEQVVAFKIATIPLPEQYQEGYSDGQSQTANELRTKLKEYFGELNGKS